MAYIQLREDLPGIRGLMVFRPHGIWRGRHHAGRELPPANAKRIPAARGSLPPAWRVLSLRLGVFWRADAALAAGLVAGRRRGRALPRLSAPAGHDFHGRGIQRKSRLGGGSAEVRAVLARV